MGLESHLSQKERQLLWEEGWARCLSLCGSIYTLRTRAGPIRARKLQLTAANQRRQILPRDRRARWSKGALASSFVL